MKSMLLDLLLISIGSLVFGTSAMASDAFSILTSAVNQRVGGHIVGEAEITAYFESGRARDEVYSFFEQVKSTDLSGPPAGSLIDPREIYATVQSNAVLSAIRSAKIVPQSQCPYPRVLGRPTQTLPRPGAVICYDAKQIAELEQNYELSIKIINNYGNIGVANGVAIGSNLEFGLLAHEFAVQVLPVGSDKDSSNEFTLAMAREVDLQHFVSDRKCKSSLCKMRWPAISRITGTSERPSPRDWGYALDETASPQFSLIASSSDKCAKNIKILTKPVLKAKWDPTRSQFRIDFNIFQVASVLEPHDSKSRVIYFSADSCSSSVTSLQDSQGNVVLGTNEFSHGQLIFEVWQRPANFGSLN